MTKGISRSTTMANSAVVVGVLLVVAAGVYTNGYLAFRGLTTVVPAAAVAYVVLRLEPVWVFSAGLFLSVFAGNWENVGIPGALAPDRWLLVLGVVGVLIRAPGSVGRSTLRTAPVHWLLAATAAYAIASASAADTLLDRTSAFGLLEHLAILPFLVFLVAQTAFRTERERGILLMTLVALGGYLGVTALLETIGAHGLLFPSYIGDGSLGTHPGRARGPFVDAVANGVALYACAAGAALALAKWRRPGARYAAGAVLFLCSAGLLFTLQRSVWLASVAATVVVLVGARELRRFLLPAAATGMAVVLISLAAVPGLADEVRDRRAQQDTVWDRKNQNRAALNMVDARPLTGFGWARFREESIDYFEQSPNYPLTGAGLDVHNVYLGYAAELGLIGLTLWATALLVGLGGALTARSPPEMRGWRLMLTAYALFYLIVSLFVPPQLFPILTLWVLIGVVWTANLAPDSERSPPSSDPRREPGLAATEGP